MIENVVFSNWVGELTSTVGDGPISLGGAINGFSSFSQFPDGSKVVYTIQDGFDKETGVGTLNGRALERTTIGATLVDGVYTISSSPLNLSGNSQVYATMNAELMKELKDAHGDISDIMQRTINGHPLTTDVLLSASDVGAQAESTVLEKIASGSTATTTEAGVVNLATPSEAVVGTDNSKALTPNAGVALAAYQIIAEHYRKQGMVTVGTFEDGAHVINANQVVISRANGVGYTYLGTIATGGFDVAPGSSPDSNWKSVVTDTTSAEISIGDAPPANAKATSLWYNTLDGRMYIRYQDADSLQWVEASPQSSIADIPEDVSNKIREALRRSYAEAGYNLVSGSFEAGGTLTSPTDVLLQEKTGKVYSWTGSYPSGGYVVAPGTDPTVVAGYAPRTDVVLRDELSSAYGSSLIGSATYAQIRAYDGSAIKIKCIGRTNVFNESHGDFYLDVTDTATPDDDGAVLVDALGRRWKRLVQNHVLIEWFGDVTTDATLAIKAAVGYCKAHDIKKIYALPREYKITSSIVIDGHLDIDATSGATFVNAVADGPAFMIGTDPTIWNGFAARIEGARIIGDTTVTQSSNCHGIEIKAMRAEIRNCTFSNLKGSGIKGTFSQYSHIEKNAFDSCDRYGIEVYSPDWNLYMAGDMVIRDNYQLTRGLKLGGMYLEIGNSLVERNTFTDLSNCLTVKGWGNEIVKNTFETQPTMLDAVGKQITVIPYAGMANVLRNNTLMGAHLGIVPITIDPSGSGKTVIDSCEFMESPKAGTQYVENTGSLPVVFTGENIFADTTARVANGSSSEWLQTYRKKVDSISTTGAGPFYFASTFKLPCNGTWEIAVTSGGNGNDYVNHRGSRVFLVHVYGNQYTFEYLTTSKVIGGATIVDISSVVSSGIVVTCGNNLNGVGSITFSAKHICAE